MTTEEALLAAIWASPHDNLPRLVYADWLDETGDSAKAARAEFIRVQCELTRLEEHDPCHDLLTKTEGELIRQHEAEFCPHLPDQATRVEFDRGFALPTLRISVKRLHSRGPNFLRHVPLWAFDLSTAGQSGEFAALTKTDKLTRTARLRLGTERYHHSVEYGVWLAAAECFRNLTHLDLEAALAGAAPTVQLREFCRASNMPLLRELSFEGSGLTVDTVPHLTGAPFALTLRSLKISDVERFSPEGLSLLVSAPSFSTLREFELRWFRHDHPDVYLDRFARDAALPNLKRLALPFAVVEPEWITPFRHWSGADGLEELNLGSGTMSAVQTLISARIFPNLKRMRVDVSEYNLSHTRIMFGPTTEVITPHDPRPGLVQFAADYGITLQLGQW